MLLNHEGGISEVARDLREAQASFSSFACVNKICHRLYYEESWRVISIHGPDAANQLISLFQILHNNPRISSFVKEFVLHFDLNDDPSRISIMNMAFLMRPDIPRIVGRGTMSRDRYYSLLDIAYREQLAPVQNSKYILWATALVFHGLSHLTHLTISVPGHTLAYGKTLMFGGGTVGFPSLQSLTIHDTTRSVDEVLWTFPPPCVWDSVLGNTPGVSDVFLHNFNTFDGFFEQEANGFGVTLTSLVLDYVEIHYQELQFILQNCTALGKFVCRQAIITLDDDLFHAQILDPEDEMIPLMTLLSERAATLHTICLPSVHKLPAALHGHCSFSEFRNLQSFWLEAGFNEPLRDGPNTRPLQGRILQTLPASLKRLHLEGKLPEEDLSWLVSNCRSRFPELKELALDPTYVNCADMRRLVQQLRDIGVSIVRVDPYPQLW